MVHLALRRCSRCWRHKRRPSQVCRINFYNCTATFHTFSVFLKYILQWIKWNKAKFIHKLFINNDFIEIKNFWAKNTHSHAVNHLSRFIYPPNKQFPEICGQKTLCLFSYFFRSYFIDALAILFIINYLIQTLTSHSGISLCQRKIRLSQLLVLSTLCLPLSLIWNIGKLYSALPFSFLSLSLNRLNEINNRKNVCYLYDEYLNGTNLCPINGCALERITDNFTMIIRSMRI